MMRNGNTFEKKRKEENFLMTRGYTRGNGTSKFNSARMIRVDNVHQVLDLLHREVEACVEQNAAKFALIDLAQI